MPCLLSSLRSCELWFEEALDVALEVLELFADDLRPLVGAGEDQSALEHGDEVVGQAPGIDGGVRGVANLRLLD